MAISILASLSAIGILALSEGWIEHRKTETEHKAGDSRFATGDLYGVRVETCLTGMFWTFNGETVCSAPIALYMDVVDKQSVPAMISQFDIQLLEASGVWRQLAHVHPNGVHFGTTLSQVAPIKDEFLDSQIENRNISPGEALRGWVLLSIRDAPGKMELEPEFKATIADFGGGHYAATEPPRPTMDSAQPRSVSIAGMPRDLRRFKFSTNCGH